MLYYVPNLLTLFRIAAAPVLVLLLKYGANDLAVVLFVAAGVSDGLDGYIAKRFNYQTRLGAILDPVADKLLLVSSYVMLTLLGHLPFWLLVTVVFRDVVIVGGYLVLVTLNGSVHMQPSIVSKLNTVLQITLVGVVLVAAAQWLSIPWLTSTMIVLVTITTVLSGVHYVWFWGFRRDSAVSGQHVNGRT